MIYPFRSRFVYGVSPDLVDWTTTLPTRAWGFRTATVGGSRTAATGVPAAYVARRDHNLVVPMRLYENEWESLHGLLEWGQYAEAFLWYPDALGQVIADSYPVYLEHPQAGEDIRPERDSSYPLVLEVTLEFRRADGEPWDLVFY